MSSSDYDMSAVDAGGYDARRDAPSPDVSDTSFGDLVGNLSGDLSRLVRQEIELAKVETRQEISKAGQGAGMFAGAGVGGHLMLVFLSLALMFAIGDATGLGWAALIVGVLWAIVAAVLFLVGKKRLAAVNPALPETTESLKEDAQWVKTRNS